jgi:hypothetical protein
VGRFKLVVLLMICIAAVAILLAVYKFAKGTVYKFAKGTEEADFEVQVST